jgi:hypothetical protein
MTQKSLNFKMQDQLQDQWCWAAVSTSISLFYDLNSPWTQCKIVNKFLEKTECCKANNASSSSCNQPWYLNKALEGLGNLSKLEEGAQTLPLIAKEIDEGRPLGCLIKWDDGKGGGHFVLISGVNLDEESLDIMDPWNGPTTDLPYEVFSEKYRGDGLWTYSFYTKK